MKVGISMCRLRKGISISKTVFSRYEVTHGFPALMPTLCCSSARCGSTSAAVAVIEAVGHHRRQFYDYLRHAHSVLNRGKATWPPLLLEFLGNNTKLSRQNLETANDAIVLLDKVIESYNEVDTLMADAMEETDRSEKDELIAIGEDEKAGILQEIRERNDNIVENFRQLLDSDTIASNIVLEVSAGVGGQEAMLFAAELFDMYNTFCINYGHDFEIIDVQQTDIGGYSKASANIYFSDIEFYKYLRHESGTHRVQRVPATEKVGRIHTSTASVAILPVFENQAVKIEEKELEIQRLKKSNSPGGQHANKTESAVRIKHIPSGKVVECSAHKSQDDNKAMAIKLLKSRLSTEKAQEQETKLTKARRQQVKNRERSDKIRTYNFNQDRVTDHRIGFSAHGIANFMRGDNMLLNLMKKLNDKQELEELNAVITMLLDEGKIFFKYDDGEP